MKIDVLSLFPEAFTSFLGTSIVSRAIQKKAIVVELDDIRAYSTDKHHCVDDYPYGGFAGMVATPQPLWDAIQAKLKAGPAPVIYFTPQGRRLDQKILLNYASESHLILVCGHYKEIDQRIRRLAVSDEISLGDFVLSGGELAAQVFIDGLARLQEGVLSDIESAKSDSFYYGKLGFPCYTRPEQFMGQQVPAVLREGNHAKIEQWAVAQAELLTKIRRPDLCEHNPKGNK
ncbi:MAG: tRNA (guanosine(37)-N1)-methyltransferase TrmD [Candidatus Cloacimonetes bacterium]|jgi:tRNA (guanine37-N1)-methyltransferase|nr:tRNA (guanosine(37)-N1)-methyltransferase TrmD [Candidatus Cloacimonadota bacterium]MDY0299151.1 tRNA (guanosine(37)-N1)-methyltransferase TrmD [Candidatus Cloacimonadaceae bacterium]MCB5279091.1 tRNA (guanosine(37)-N1)-methyltransferase TrmD [Candidatus Cloacimonadota bacterium]MCK9332635.1 tRNA (guanosine(37)-N1)-methyltransferase TrmD [Candidatus Cloacimonadota bacterium]MDD2210907.1 tRNA (guanosine(37)-N1)-methyltransferase TrmD [Candidatus Cloacimonadota bacterium]